MRILPFGIVENCQNKVLRGWAAPWDFTPLLEDNFYCFVDGQNILKSVSLVYREGVIKSLKPKLKLKDKIKGVFGKNLASELSDKFGFKLELKSGVHPSQIKDLTVFYKFDGNLYPLELKGKLRDIEVNQVSQLKNRVQAEIIANQLSDLSSQKLKDAFVSERIELERLALEQKKEEEKAESERALKALTTNKGDSSFRTKVAAGTFSKKNTAVVGLDGFIFLFGGSNKVDQMYNQPEEKVASTISSWSKKLSMRNEKVTGLDSQFIQFFIPEKQSVLPRSYIRDIECPSILYKAVSSLPNCFDGFSAMTEQESPDLLWAKTDSHLSSFGAYWLSLCFVKSLGGEIDIKITPTKKRTMTGDLGTKYTPTLYELSSGLKCDLDSPTVVDKFKPKNGGHIGRSIKLVNPSAQIDKKVLVFGNSFFDFGGSSNQLSWWFSRIFTEFEFVWSPNLDYKKIESTQPDIVIAQTIERFLRLPPKI